MRTYALRTLYEAANLGFSTEGALCSGSTAAYLVRERELPYSTHETVGVASDEKREVVIATRNRKYRGNPLLLEIVASCDVPDGSSPLDVQPDLEACTARLAALLTWALPGVVGVRLADALFCRDAETLDGSWTWFDVAPIRVADYFAEAASLVSGLAAAEQVVGDLTSAHRDAAEAALRWWRQGHEVESVADRLVAYWIVLESISSALGSGDTISAKVEDVLRKAFPDLATASDGHRTKKLKDVLYRARCRAVHGGRRDLANPNALVMTAEHAAAAGIARLLNGSASKNPSAELLDTLGI